MNVQLEYQLAYEEAWMCMKMTRRELGKDVDCIDSIRELLSYQQYSKELIDRVISILKSERWM